MKGFSHIDTWVFDLDNTLYSPSCRLFDQIALRMTDYMMAKLGLGQAEATKLRHTYFKTYGTTLRGLMLEHDLEPHGFLDYVHKIDYGAIEHHPTLSEAIRALPGRKLVFTAGTRGHANAVLQNLGCNDVFECIFDITDAQFIPKPDERPYDHFLQHHQVAAERAAFFEDLPENLIVPRAKGMTTILVGAHDEAMLPAHVDYVTDDLALFLDGVLK